jgi:hypothetical protein
MLLRHSWAARRPDMGGATKPPTSAPRTCLPSTKCICIHRCALTLMSCRPKPTTIPRLSRRSIGCPRTSPTSWVAASSLIGLWATKISESSHPAFTHDPTARYTGRYIRNHHHAAAIFSCCPLVTNTPAQTARPLSPLGLHTKVPLLAPSKHTGQQRPTHVRSHRDPSYQNQQQILGPSTRACQQSVTVLRVTPVSTNTSCFNFRCLESTPPSDFVLKPQYRDMQPVLLHHCHCTYDTPVAYSPFAFSQNISCSHVSLATCTGRLSLTLRHSAAQYQRASTFK